MRDATFIMPDWNSLADLTENERKAVAQQQSDADDSFHDRSEAELKAEFGEYYRQTINHIYSLFRNAPGGCDINDEKALVHRLLGGRNSDGNLVGNDPDFIRWLDAITRRNSLNAKTKIGFYMRLLEGRMTDGKCIGTDPDMMRWLVSLITR